MKELTREREKGRKEYEDKIEKLDEEQKTMAEVIEKREREERELNMVQEVEEDIIIIDLNLATEDDHIQSQLSGSQKLVGIQLKGRMNEKSRKL